MILAILNLHVAPMPPTKFGLNLTKASGADVVSRWQPRWPSWIAKQKDLSNSESLCRSNASHLVSAQSNLRFGKRYHLKNSNMAAVAAILEIRTEQF